MDFLPKGLGTRPRLAVEVRTEGVVAARAEDATGVLVAVSRANLPASAVMPGLKAGNIVDRSAVTAAVRSALDSVAGRGSERTRDVTLVLPDEAVRVLLLDFDALPSKPIEALPVVRFRLKKLLPFEVDEAVVSYQMMSSTKGNVAVLAVAIPREVLAEYEGVVTAAGYMPGAVLPSTLAALAGLGFGASGAGSEDGAALVVSTGAHHVTAAIVKSGVLLLHRALDMELGVAESAGAGGIASEELDRMDAEASMQARVVSEAATEPGEIAQAVSVAAAYFEDTLSTSPEVLLAAGTMSAEMLERMLSTSGLVGLQVRELMEPGMLAAGAATASVPRGWLAGVKGALTN
jgi:type IV pilus assembly protein PilM